MARKVGLETGFAVPLISKNKLITVFEFFMPKLRNEDTKLFSLISRIAPVVGSVIKCKQMEEILQRN